MAASILKTKLNIPKRQPDHVSRQRLIDKLNYGSDGKLVLIAAPAGSGKSSLVVDWLHQNTLHTAWVSLDDRDRDIERFLAYVVAALQGIDERIGVQLQNATDIAMAEAVTILLNDLEDIAEPVALVLDDYHQIDNLDIHLGLDLFLDYLPPHVTLVMTTRADPPLSLPRLRARNQMVELRQEDLRFTLAETEDFLQNSMGLNLSDTEVQSLEQRTEGWIAGLRMVGVSLQSASDTSDFITQFAGSHRYITDYLMDEVLNRLADFERQFLLQTSLLGELCGALCDGVTQREDSQQLLERFETMNLFVIPLDDKRHWFRYHHLFATLLQHRLAQLPKEVSSLLHQRAASWYEAQDMVELAIQHHQDANNPDGMARLIGQYGNELLQPGYLNQLQGWLDGLPLHYVQDDPHLAGLQAWIHYFFNQTDQVNVWVDYAQRALDQPQRRLNESDHQAKWSIVGLQSWLVYQQGDFARAAQLAEEALDKLTDSADVWRSMTYVFLGHALVASGRTAEAFIAYDASLQYVGTGNHIAVTGITNGIVITNILRGQLNQARLKFDRLIEQVNKLGQSLSATLPRLARLAILYEQNDLAQIQSEFDKLRHMTRIDSSFTTTRYQYMTIVYDIAVGENERALDTLRKLEEDVSSWANIDERTRFMAGLIRVYLRLGYHERASEWLQSIDINENDITLLRMDEYMAVADISRFGKSPQLIQRGLLILEKMHRLCTDAQLEGVRIGVNCLQALLIAASGDALGALQPLREALAAGEPEGYVRTFVDFGQPMAHLLYEAVARDIHVDYAGYLLTQFPEQTNQQADSKFGQNPIERLSDRELEILALLAQGLSNQVIANQLVLSLNTVKVHNRNIYGKLNAQNRTEAVAKARQLGIID